MNAKYVATACALLLPLPLLLASRAPGTKVSFAPAEGLELSKKFELKSDLSLEDMTITGAGASPEVEMKLAMVHKIEVSDQYVKSGDGKPSQLKRTYDSVGSDVVTSMKMEIMGQSREQDSNMTATTELEGKRVLFQWDAEAGKFKKTFDPEGPEEKLLEGLEEDMDLRGLLPKGDVEEGATWEIAPKDLAHVFAPGGSMSLVAKDSEGGSLEMGPSGMENPAELFGDDVEGTATGTFKGMKEVDGRKLAVIAIDIDVRAKSDLTEQVQEALGKNDPPPGIDELTIESMDIDMSIDCEGELLWDLQGGHFRSLDLSGTATFKSEQSIKMSVQGRSMPITQSMEFSGTMNCKASAE